jgi:hypothetical protein
MSDFQGQHTTRSDSGYSARQLINGFFSERLGICSDRGSLSSRSALAKQTKVRLNKWLLLSIVHSNDGIGKGRRGSSSQENNTSYRNLTKFVQSEA